MRILIADDDAVSRRILEARLTQWGYQVQASADGVEALAALRRPEAPRLAILDWVMPGLNGLQVCRELRASSSDDYVYILLLTAKDRKEDLLLALESGADDYLIKPFDPAELKARLRTGQRILDLQADLIAAREALRLRATRDSLTGLWNRGATLDIVARELARAQREGQPFSLGLADIDHFKAINDGFGHGAGDAVLREVSRRLQQAMRSYDSIGRYGGEEFLIVLPGCDPAAVPAVAERLRACVGDDPIPLAERHLPVTISLGVASLLPGVTRGPADQDALIRAADGALYRAKQAGRNRVAAATFEATSP